MKATNRPSTHAIKLADRFQRSEALANRKRVHFIPLLVVICCFGMTSVRASKSLAQDPPPEAINLYTEAANLQNANEFELAAELWESFVGKYPDLKLSLRAQHYWGVCLLQLGEIDQAKERFAAVAESPLASDEPGILPDTLLNLGWCHFNLASGDTQQRAYADAAKAFERLIEEFDDNPNVAQAAYFLGECRYLSGQVEESLEPYQSVLEDHPESSLRPNAVYALGVAYTDLDRSDEALQTFAIYQNEFADRELAAEVDMRVAELILQRALSTEQSGEDASSDFSKAGEQFKQLATNQGYDQRDLALFKQAFCSFKLGDLAAAAETYALVASTFPDSSYANAAALSAGRTFFREANLEQALRWLGQVDTNDPVSSTEAAHWICRIHLQQENPAEAYLVANGRLANAPNDSPYTVLLMLDRADAAYAIPDRKSVAFDLYLEIAESYPDDPTAGQALYYASFAAFEADQFDQAVQQADRYQAQFPDGPLLKDVLSVAGEAQLQTGNYTDAEQTFERLVKLTPENNDHEGFLIRYALTKFLQNDYEGTKALLESAAEELQAASSKAEAYFLIGSCDFRNDRFDEAVDALSASLSATTDWRQGDEAMLLLARSHFRHGDPNAALETAERCLETFPESAKRIESYYRVGEYAYAVDQYDKAIDAYQRALEAEPSSTSEPIYRPYALDGKAWTLFKQGKFEPSVAAFSELLGEFPEHSLSKQARYGRAVCSNQVGAHQSALDDLVTYLSQDLAASEQANGLFEQGIAYVGLNQIEQAVRSFTQLLENHTEFDRREQALYELGWCYLDLNQASQAQTPFEQIATRYPDGRHAAEAQFHLGELDYQSKDYEQAAAHYTESIAAADDSPIAENALYKLGWTHFHRDDFGEALKTFTDQRERFPDGTLELDGQFMIAESCYRAERFDRALEVYRGVWPKLDRLGSEANPTYVASTLLHGAQAAVQQQDWDTAVLYGEKFVTDFDSAREIPEALLQVGRGYQGLGKLEEAETALEKAALQSSDHVGAQARFFVGELYFQKREYDEAQKQYRRVMLGYGGANATAKVKLFQAMSAYEAGRCADVQIRDAAEDRKADLIEQAIGFYQDVLDKFGENPYQESARERIDVLSRQ